MRLRLLITGTAFAFVSDSILLYDREARELAFARAIPPCAEIEPPAVCAFSPYDIGEPASPMS